MKKTTIKYNQNQSINIFKGLYNTLLKKYPESHIFIINEAENVFDVYYESDLTDCEYIIKGYLSINLSIGTIYEPIEWFKPMPINTCITADFDYKKSLMANFIKDDYDFEKFVQFNRYLSILCANGAENELNELYFIMLYEISKSKTKKKIYTHAYDSICPANYEFKTRMDEYLSSYENQQLNFNRTIKNIADSSYKNNELLKEIIKKYLDKISIIMLLKTMLLLAKYNGYKPAIYISNLKLVCN